MNNNEAKSSTLAGAAIIALGETVVSLAIIGVYLALDKFTYKVVTGVVLGSLVTLAYFLILSLSVNRAVNRYLERMKEVNPEGEEEREKFARENSSSIQLATTVSYITRTLLTAGALVVAFLTKQFEVLATVIPLLAYTPIIYLSEIIRKRKER